ncbi:class I SAM-dependent methyltransferase [Cryobacterium sp. Y11]|uniref:class I SAM-dependent methyltransferase n=1 Tax=Cryobacterium sp. Y11 TaxID=2045016 RepID=UPI001E6378DF|nr:class I SAM-dependent methyltransferase [Cryobacterium sp. Y11]
MSALEGAFCRSAPWRLAARRVVRWVIQGVSLTGDVLEIGGGNGATAAELARANASLRLTMIDYDPVMVGAARKRLAEYSHAAARQGDATQLPFDDETFDFVVSFLMLHHVVDWEKAIAEVARVLRPGGIFTGYDLTASRAASWVHLADRSPHRLIERGAFEPVLAQVRLDAVGLRYSFGGRVLRFTARKPALST